jgi:Resolvase, N terminal domain
VLALTIVRRRAWLDSINLIESRRLTLGVPTARTKDSSKETKVDQYQEKSAELCAIYARSATFSAHAIAAQLTACLEAVEQQGWLSAEHLIFVDNGESGNCLSRPGLTALLAAVESEHCPFSRVVVVDTSRLGRSVSVLLTVIYKLERNSISVLIAGQHPQAGVLDKTRAPTSSIAALLQLAEVPYTVRTVHEGQQ